MGMRVSAQITVICTWILVGLLGVCAQIAGVRVMSARLSSTRMKFAFHSTYLNSTHLPLSLPAHLLTSTLLASYLFQLVFIAFHLLPPSFTVSPLARLSDHHRLIQR